MPLHIAAPVGAAILSGGAALASQLLGGIFGDSSTKKTNATNLQIARENNQTSIDIANANNKLSYEMFLRQLEYTSPSEQRRMLEDAGYNPASYLQGSQASAASAPSLQQPSLMTPSMQVPTNLAQNISNLGMSLGQMYKDISEASLLNEQKRTQTIDNETRHQQNVANLIGQGLYNQAMQADWSWKVETMEDRVLQERFKALALDAEKRLSVARAAHEEIDNVTRKQFNAKQLKQLDEAINLLVEEQNTEVSKQKLNEAGISEKVAQVARLAVMNAIDKYNAETNRIVGNSQASSNYANAELAKENASNVRINNKLLKFFGPTKEALAVRSLVQDVVGKQTDTINKIMSRKQILNGAALVWQQIEYAKKENDAYNTKLYLQIYNSLMDSLK